MKKPSNHYDYFTRIKLSLWSNDPNFIALVDHIQKNIPKIGNQEIRKKSLTIVVANLYYNWKEDHDRYVGYYRDVNKYKARSMYNVLNISKIIIKLIDNLVDLNYLEQKKGFYDRNNQSRTARMKAKPKLVKLFEKYKLKPGKIELHPSTPSIILRNIKDDSKYQVDFKSDEQAESMRKSLAAYNNLLRRSHIAIPNYPKEGILKENGHKIVYNENN